MELWFMKEGVIKYVNKVDTFSSWEKADFMNQ